MDTGLYSGVAAMRASEKRMEAITANLANLDTPAFKRLTSSTRAFDLGEGARRRTEVVTQNAVDFGQGVLERTGNALDLGLEGPGFFAVESPAGEVYTRNGSFHLDEQGVLQTQDGYPVAWEGARGVLTPVGDPITVDGSGLVRQGANDVGRIKLAGFAEPARLEHDARGYWHAPADLAPAAPEATVHQGASERSNASSIDELVEMVRVQRSFESAASLMRSIEQSYRRLNQQR